MTIINLWTSADKNPGTIGLIIILTLFLIEDILPYKIGLYVMSVVAFCALVFGMIMYAKRKNSWRGLSNLAAWGRDMKVRSLFNKH